MQDEGGADEHWAREQFPLPNPPAGPGTHLNRCCASLFFSRAMACLSSASAGAAERVPGPPAPPALASPLSVGRDEGGSSAASSCSPIAAAG